MTDEIRLIDANALLGKSFCTAPATMNNPYGGDSVVLVNDIENAPTIDPESLRPQGEWVKWGNKIICSHCKGEPVYANLEGFILTTYCPDCGAKMKI